LAFAAQASMVAAEGSPRDAGRPEMERFLLVSEAIPDGSPIGQTAHNTRR
jgi:hypothetical protein